MAATAPNRQLRRPQGVMWLLRTLVLTAQTPFAYAGDNGEDFSNNLFSDLAPILSLFGEQVAKQFMAGSTCWEDSIIFAMAPLGIITAIVLAIRIGGPRWLRALVGRARENKTAAEVELTTSTSRDTCEMWNGQAMVRLLGAPRILELVYIPTAKAANQENMGLWTIEDAKASGDDVMKLREDPRFLQK